MKKSLDGSELTALAESGLKRSANSNHGLDDDDDDDDDDGGRVRDRVVASSSSVGE